MEVTVSLSAFSSESSAGSEKAQKMGLISAGFGRYRTKKGGPITHKIVKGKLIKSAPALNVAQKLFIVEELDFAASKDLSDAVKYIKSFGLKAVGGVEHGINGNPEASVVGTKPQLVKFLKEYFGGDPHDDISDMVKKPYNPKKSTTKSHSAGTKSAQKLFMLDDCDFSGSDTLAEVKEYCAPFGVKVVNGVEDGINGMPTADIVGTKEQLRKFLKEYNGLDLQGEKLDKILKPYNPKKSKLKSQSAGTKFVQKLYVADDCDFAGSDTLAEVKKYCAQFGCKIVNGIEDGVNGMPTADVVGTLAQLRKFLIGYMDLDLDDVKAKEVLKPYNPKKSKMQSQSAGTKFVQKLYVAEDCDFAGSDTLAEVKKWCSQFGVKIVNGIEDGVNGMPTADVVGTLAQLRKFLVAYMDLDLDDVKAKEVLKPYNPRKSKLKSQSGSKASSMCAEVDFGVAVSKQEIPELVADLNSTASTNVKVDSVSRSPQGSYSAVVTGSKSDLRKFLTEFYDGSDITSAEIVDMIESQSGSKSSDSVLGQLDELEDEIKELRKKLLREYKDFLDEDEEYDSDDAEAFVEDDNRMRKLLDKKLKLQKKLKNK